MKREKFNSMTVIYAKNKNIENDEFLNQILFRQIELQRKIDFFDFKEKERISKFNKNVELVCNKTKEIQENDCRIFKSGLRVIKENVFTDYAVSAISPKLLQNTNAKEVQKLIELFNPLFENFKNLMARTTVWICTGIVSLLMLDFQIKYLRFARISFMLKTSRFYFVKERFVMC